MKKIAMDFTMVALVLGISATGAIAFEGGPGKMRAGLPIDFKVADANSDGKLTPEEMKSYKMAGFTAADIDGNGYLSAQEIAEKIMGRMGKYMTKGAARMIKRRDTNGDGQLSQEEIAPKDGDTRIFAQLDLDNDGMISEAEFAKGADRRDRNRRMKNGPASE